jgi:hypothetical protein
MQELEAKPVSDTGELWWAGSDEWGPWTRAPAVKVLGELPTDQFERLLLVETVDDFPRRFLFGIAYPALRPTPGTPIGAIVFAPPEHWDGRELLNMSNLIYRGEATVCASQDEAPRLSDEEREKRRKGWAF